MTPAPARPTPPPPPPPPPQPQQQPPLWGSSMRGSAPRLPPHAEPPSLPTAPQQPGRSLVYGFGASQLTAQQQSDAAAAVRHQAQPL